ncbi:hypothetical protein GS429_14185 [Natronorubrum sp. JWXQ-INN-674]|uniref:Uncharacterized protein n=1 Tax=Natronorubrum halalkaliphilum TaxID=2691917 RepID=A0A6B0VPK3_9EURY|nr:hypothetical protein [Natronorubrum halalkaliphilum]
MLRGAFGFRFFAPFEPTAATLGPSLEAAVSVPTTSLSPSALLSVPVPIQVTVEGGSTPVVVAAILSFFVATVLAVLVTYRFVEGYRRTKARPILLLAIGMFLLAPAPMFVRLLAGNVASVPLSAQLLLTTLSELCGLLVILYAVYTT